MRPLLTTLLASLALAAAALGQSAALTINSSTGAVNVPAGLTPNFPALKVGNVSLTATPAWSSITGTPTTLSGYGITDAQPLHANLTALSASGTTITHPGGGAPNALRIVSAVDGDTGTLDIQNTNTTNAFSAINFLTSDGNYRMSIGYGNSTFEPYSHRSYLEVNNLVGNNAVPPDFVLAQTGTNNTGEYDINARMVMYGAGLIQFLARTPGTQYGAPVISISNSGRVRFGPTITTEMDFGGFGQTQIVQESGNAVVLSITQNGVATAYLGYAASSSTMVIGSDGNSLSFQGSPGGALNSGTEYLRLNATRGTFSVRLNIPTATPASSSAAGTTGDIAWDASFIYVCTATNTWKRAAIATW